MKRHEGTKLISKKEFYSFKRKYLIIWFSSIVFFILIGLLFPHIRFITNWLILLTIIVMAPSLGDLTETYEEYKKEWEENNFNKK